MPLLSWLNDEEARAAATRVPYRILEEVPKLSYGIDSSNMLIQGDNLDALKALLPYYAGQVKCIYIDPPYNTKSAFEHYDDNLEHSTWLSMMAPRLELLWKFLTVENGVLLISINDDEGHYLKVLCDEIFGRNSFITSLVWNYEGNTDNQAKIINYHEYVLVYSKTGAIDNPNVVDPNIKEGSKLFKDEVRNTVVKNGPKNPVSDVILPAGFPANIESIRIPKSEIDWPKYSDDLIIENNKLVKSVKAESGWASKTILNAFIDAGFADVVDSKGQLTRFELTKTGAIEGVKKRKQEKGHFISVLRGFGTTNQMRLLLQKMGITFTYPKPIDLIKYLIDAFTDDGDIILDSFAGSGTTAHSVFKANYEEETNRRFIVVEMSESNAVDVIFPRLKGVIDGHEKAQIPKHGGGFRFYKLGEAVFDEEGHINPKIKFAPLAAHVWFSETGIPYKGKAKSPFLGTHDGIAFGLLYNGILGDKAVNGGNVLTRQIFKDLVEASDGFKGSWVIYGESSRITPAKLEEQNIMFKQTPYDIKAR